MKEYSKGFSLVELLVIIAIMAVMAAMALPSFITWQRTIRYKEAAWGILSQLRLGRQLAVSNNREFRVFFDVDGRRYRLERGNSSAGSTVWTVEKPWTALDQLVNWATGTACNGTDDMNIEFNPNGTAEASSTDTICIQNTDGVEQYRLVVYENSGRVQIVD